jgi:hypothetical protein
LGFKEIFQLLYLILLTKHDEPVQRNKLRELANVLREHSGHKDGLNFPIVQIKATVVLRGIGLNEKEFEIFGIKHAGE